MLTDVGVRVSIFSQSLLASVQQPIYLRFIRLHRDGDRFTSVTAYIDEMLCNLSTAYDVAVSVKLRSKALCLHATQRTPSLYMHFLTAIAIVTSLNQRSRLTAQYRMVLSECRYKCTARCCCNALTLIVLAPCTACVCAVLRTCVVQFGVTKQDERKIGVGSSTSICSSQLAIVSCIRALSRAAPASKGHEL